MHYATPHHTKHHSTSKPHARFSPEASYTSPSHTTPFASSSIGVCLEIPLLTRLGVLVFITLSGGFLELCCYVCNGVHASMSTQSYKKYKKQSYAETRRHPPLNTPRSITFHTFIIAHISSFICFFRCFFACICVHLHYTTDAVGTWSWKSHCPEDAGAVVQLCRGVVVQCGIEQYGVVWRSIGR
jgi:hypothetical protein